MKNLGDLDGFSIPIIFSYSLYKSNIVGVKIQTHFYINLFNNDNNIENSKEEEETISFESIYNKIIEALEEEEGLKI